MRIEIVDGIKTLGAVGYVAVNLIDDDDEIIYRRGIAAWS